MGIFSGQPEKFFPVFQFGEKFTPPPGGGEWPEYISLCNITISMTIYVLTTNATFGLSYPQKVTVNWLVGQVATATFLKIDLKLAHFRVIFHI